MISLVVAYADNQVIGKDGTMPWHLPNDLKYFKELTSGHTVVMGRKTFESIGKPLPGRRNIVLSRNRDFSPEGVEVIHDVADLPQEGDLFILGGEHIFRQFLDLADRLYITKIDLQTEGDTFFPEWDRDQFTLVSTKEGILDEKNKLPHTFYVYERKQRRSS